MVENVIMEYLHDKRHPNPFLQDRPGKDWWFTRRWPSLTERKPQHLQANRATALTEGAITSWIFKVSTIVTDTGLSEMTTAELTRKMWNCDEMAFATDAA